MAVRPIPTVFSEVLVFRVGFRRGIWNSFSEGNDDPENRTRIIEMEQQMNTQMKSPGVTHLDELARLKLTLDSSPLATDEFGVALNHLNNAQAYFSQGEVGAGLFEMRIVTDKLTRKKQKVVRLAG